MCIKTFLLEIFRKESHIVAQVGLELSAFLLLILPTVGTYKARANML